MSTKMYLLTSSDKEYTLLYTDLELAKATKLSLEEEGYDIVITAHVGDLSFRQLVNAYYSQKWNLLGAPLRRAVENV